MNDLITFVANEIGTIRRENLEGREHIVIPMVMMVEGVHRGSEGDLFYPGTSLDETASVWDHKPVIVNHAEKDGKYVSACKPEYLNAQKVGIVLNSRFEPGTATAPLGKLRAEAWIEPERLKAINPALYKKVLANKTLELSTGLYKDEVATEGEFNGEKYSRIAANLQPDHLALLTEAIGACSCKKGCGLNANQEGGDLVLNAMSYGKTHEVLQQALYETAKQPGGLSGYVRDVYPDFCVIQHRESDTLFKQPYSVSDKGEVSFTGKSTKLDRVSEYRTADTGAFVGNCSIAETQEEKGVAPVSKKELVDKIIAANKGWTEAGHRAALETMPEDHLTILVANCAAPAAPPPVVPPAAPPVVPPVTTNAAPRSMTSAEWFAQAPPEVQAVLAENMRVAKAQKEATVNQIIANQTTAGVPAEFVYGKDFLMGQPPEFLNGLAATAAAAARPVVANAFGGGSQVPIYAGQQGGAYGGGYQQFAANVGEDTETLDPPSTFPQIAKTA